jgi:DNA-binding NtrC family response regulator
MIKKMTREDELWSMTGNTLLTVAEKLGIKTTKSTLKQGKEKLIAKILKVEHVNEETDKIEDTKEQAESEQPEAENEEAEENEQPETTEQVTLVPKRGALIEYDGKSQNICAWAREIGISANTLYARIYNLGWSVEKAFSTPSKRNK